jgi:Hint domain
MTLVINAVDSQFGTATGSNVNSSAGISTFDHPPSATTDLVITASAGDTGPYSFENGDVYDLTWSSASGGMALDNAIIIRSDDRPEGGSVVVFEGYDAAGSLVHLVWAPGVDVEAWYAQNHTGTITPGFYVTDQDSGSSYQHICFDAAMRVLTPAGPRPVGALAVGDLVHTLDAGPMPLRWIGRRARPGLGRDMPVRFAPGVLGNTAPLILSPQHRVLLAGPLIELFTGENEVLVPAKALVGYPGVRPVPRGQVAYVTLLFDTHALVLAGGAEVETLFLGPVAEAALQADAAAGDVAAKLALQRLSGRHIAVRPILSAREAFRIRIALGRAPLVAGASGAGVPGIARQAG